MFRVNYGNGQVSRTFSSKAAALQELACVEGNGGCYVQRYMGDGEWAKA